MANFMKKQVKNEDKNINIDAIAEQWVNLLLTHIEAKKQKINILEKNRSIN